MAKLEYHFLDPNFFYFEISGKGLAIMEIQILKTDGPIFKNALLPCSNLCPLQ